MENKYTLTVKELIDKLSKLAPYAGVYFDGSANRNTVTDYHGRIYCAITKADYYTDEDGTFWVII